MCCYSKKLKITFLTQDMSVLATKKTTTKNIFDPTSFTIFQYIRKSIAQSEKYFFGRIIPQQTFHHRNSSIFSFIVS